MMFRLKNALDTFQRIIAEIFGEFIPTFMQVFLDDFAIYGMRGYYFTPSMTTLRTMSCRMSQPQSGQVRIRGYKQSPSRARSEQGRYCGGSRQNESHSRG